LPIYDLDYSDLNERSATKQLQTLVKITTDKVMPWVHKVTEAGELAQIKQHGVQDWNELRWIEDYEQFLRETLQ
jgi:hypothetical protein